MASPHLTQPNDFPRVIQHALDQLRQGIRKYALLEGIAWITVWTTAMFWLGFLIDYIPVRLGADETPRAFRMAWLILIALGTVWIFVQRIARRMWHKISAGQLALLLERRFPQLNDTLVTTVELAGHPTGPGARSSLLAHTGQLAQEQLARLPIGRVFDYTALSRAWLVAIACGVSLAIFAAVSWPTFRHAVARLVALDDAPWPRQTFLEAVGFNAGRMKVTRGNDMVLRVRADATLRVAPPLTCSVTYRTQDGDYGRFTMAQAGTPTDGFQYYQFIDRPFRGILTDIRLDIVGNDFRLRDLHVEVLDSPAFVAPELTCTPPAYTGLSARTEIPQDGLRLPEGTRVVFRAQTNRSMRQVEVRDVNSEQPPQTKTVTTTPFTFDLGALESSRILEFTLEDNDGLRSQEPYRLTVLVIEDEPPKLDVSYRGIGSAICPMARIPLAGTITDEYGIRSLNLSARVKPEADASGIAAEATPLIDADLPVPDGAWRYTIDLLELPGASTKVSPTALAIRPGSTLSLALTAEDGYALTEQTHNTKLNLPPLRIVRPEELLAMLEGRELSLRRRFEQVLEEMETTRDTLVRMKASISAPPETAEAAARNVDANTIRARRVDAHATRTQPELEGIAASYGDIWEELQNNRVDTPEMQERIEAQLAQPLDALTRNSFPKYAAQASALVSQSADGLAAEQVQDTIAASDRVLIEMRAILQQMLELESFNELIELLRQMLRDQQDVSEETDKLRRDALKGLLED